MALVVDGGGLVNKGGALGTGAACCCNKCSGPCPNGDECAPGCACVDGQCVVVVIESCVGINGCTSDSDCVFQGQDDLAPAGCYCVGYFPAANGEPEQLGTCNANEFP